MWGMCPNGKFYEQWQIARQFPLKPLRSLRGSQPFILVLSRLFCIFCVGYSAFLSSFGSPTFFNISLAFSNFLGKSTLSLKKSSICLPTQWASFLYLCLLVPLLIIFKARWGILNNLRNLSFYSNTNKLKNFKLFS